MTNILAQRVTLFFGLVLLCSVVLVCAGVAATTSATSTATATTATEITATTGRSLSRKSLPRLLWVETDDNLRCAVTDALPYDPARCQQVLLENRRSTHLREGVSRWLLALPNHAEIGLGGFSGEGLDASEPVLPLGQDRGWPAEVTARITQENQQQVVRGQQIIVPVSGNGLTLVSGDLSSEIRLAFERLEIPPAAAIESAFLRVHTHKVLSAPLPVFVTLHAIDPYAEDVFQRFGQSGVDRVRGASILPVAKSSEVMQSIDVTLLLQRWMTRRSSPWCFGEGIGVSLSLASGDVLLNGASLDLASVGESRARAPRLVVRFRAPPEHRVCAVRHSGAPVKTENDDGLVLKLATKERAIHDETPTLPLRRQQPVFLTFRGFRFPSSERLRVLNARLRVQVAETVTSGQRLRLVAWRLPARASVGETQEMLAAWLAQGPGNRVNHDWQLARTHKAGSQLESPNLAEILMPVFSDRDWRDGDTVIIGVFALQDDGALEAFQMGGDFAPFLKVSWQGIYPVADLRSHRNRLLATLDALPDIGPIGGMPQLHEAFQQASKAKSVCPTVRVTALMASELVTQHDAQNLMQRGVPLDLAVLGTAAQSASGVDHSGVSWLNTSAYLRHYLTKTDAVPMPFPPQQQIGALRFAPPSFSPAVFLPESSTSSASGSPELPGGTVLSPVIVSFFEPVDTVFWRGNVRRFRWDWSLGKLLDSTGKPVLLSSAGGAWSFNQQAVDDWAVRGDTASHSARDAIAQGGAADAIVAAYAQTQKRRLFTYTGTFREQEYAQLPTGGQQHSGVWQGVDLDQPEHHVHYQPALVQAMGITGQDEAMQRRTVAWLRGGLPGERATPRLGAFLSSESVWVHYASPAKSKKDPKNAVVFASSHQGLLHALDAQSGRELWAYMPSRFLPKVPRWFRNGLAERAGGLESAVLVGLDGPITVWNGSASQEPVMLYVTQGRGGRELIALNVTDSRPDNPSPHPRLQFVIRGADTGPYARLGQTWSKPVLTRMRVQKGEHTMSRPALIFGGGYDPRYFDGDAGVFEPPKQETRGNAIYAVDAENGALLWWASLRDAHTVHPAMRYSIPMSPVVLDLNGDGLADRLYVADVLGQVFRITFSEKRGVSSSATRVSAEVRLLAQLGGKGREARRFFDAPSVGTVRSGDGKFRLSLAFGSGNRAAPLESFLSDGIFVVYDDYFERTKSAAQVRLPIRVAELPVAARSSAQGVRATRSRDLEARVTGSEREVVNTSQLGWRLLLGADGRIGEKVWGSPILYQGTLYATTWTPNVPNSGNSCPKTFLSEGVSRLYRLRVENGSIARTQGSAAGVSLISQSIASQSINSFGRFPSLQLVAEPSSAGDRVAILAGDEWIPLTEPSRDTHLFKTDWRRVK